MAWCPALLPTEEEPIPRRATRPQSGFASAHLGVASPPRRRSIFRHYLGHSPHRSNLSPCPYFRHVWSMGDQQFHNLGYLELGQGQRAIPLHHHHDQGCPLWHPFYTGHYSLQLRHLQLMLLLEQHLQRAE